jgi:hypothetical protein
MKNYVYFFEKITLCRRAKGGFKNGKTPQKRLV